MTIKHERDRLDQQEPQDDRCDLILIVSASLLGVIAWLGWYWGLTEAMQ